MIAYGFDGAINGNDTPGALSRNIQVIGDGSRSDLEYIFRCKFVQEYLTQRR